jgi:hypothetical protein
MTSCRSVNLRSLRGLYFTVAASAFAQVAIAASSGVHNATVTSVAVNGGADTTNPGITCIQVSPPPPATCTGGWVAIINNNKQLVSAALLAKSTSARVILILDDASGTQHCPWLAFTTCSVVSLILQ